MLDSNNTMPEIIHHDGSEEAEKLLMDIIYALDKSAIVAITDRRGKITYVNELFTEISQYTAEELIGSDHRIINSNYHPRNFFKTMWATIGRGKIWRGEICNRRVDGSFYWVDTTIVPSLNEKGRPYQYISIRYDVTERKESERIIQNLACKDQLTGLPNRSSFRELVKREVEFANESNTKLGFVYFDIDRLRYVNDSLGNEAGDYILSMVSNRLKENLQDDHVYGRLSGDEFALLLKNIRGAEHAEQLTKEIQQFLEEPIEVMGQLYTLSFSLGIALYPEHAQKPSELAMKAEKALSNARAKGGGKFEMYEHGTAAKTLERILLENELRKSISLGHFNLDYQPKVDLKTGDLMGVEALVRWNHPDLGRIPPDKFIPVAEETKLILPLGEWIIHEACKQARKWQDADFAPVRIAINISAIQLKEPGIVEAIKRILVETGVTSERIEIELTESAFADRSGMQDVIQEIRDLGITIAIDDFGTGYSTFSYIKELPADTLKIDRAFIGDIHENEESRAIVKAILAVAGTVGLRVIAEGIECEEQAAILHEYGCEEGQGYFYSRPTTPDKCVSFMKRVYE
ncbi:EAL domain-containing protein [Filibacter tadaridae]|uniref:Cyclic di-GMP phosphodiesterase Gmr n=1 Tax=Filibacter tadaridae TaxID=2483811 RepID=A0A3P5X2D0_9BACL|nr:EAL domain-containing protein [Filibacter tadaridae]VDC22407.1 Cyclic di-GMP phosphodiesterase Gmr [Filibacter tadaridae]